MSARRTTGEGVGMIITCTVERPDGVRRMPVHAAFAGDPEVQPFNVVEHWSDLYPRPNTRRGDHLEQLHEHAGDARARVSVPLRPRRSDTSIGTGPSGSALQPARLIDRRELGLVYAAIDARQAEEKGGAK